MLERVEGVIKRNELDYETNGEVLTLKFGRAGGRVKIKYDLATQSYLYNCSEYLFGLSSLILFVWSFMLMYQPIGTWSGLFAGLMFAGAIFNLFQVVLAHIQMLDIKAQLRTVGVYLKPDF